MAETLSILSIVAFALSGLCLVLTVLFWFMFRIPGVIGDLTGATARKSIAQMRSDNERSGSKNYRASPANAARGKVTASMKTTGSLKTGGKSGKLPRGGKSAGHVETGLLVENRAQEALANETMPLDVSGSEETAPLYEEHTAPMAWEDNTMSLEEDATGRLDDEDATVVLTETLRADQAQQGGVKMELLDNVMLIHTTEVIL